MTVFSTNDSNRRKPRTMQAWSKYRRENPRDFYSPRVQDLMLKDRKELGEAFYERVREEGDA
jgi:hypothetical protein